MSISILSGIMRQKSSLVWKQRKTDLLQVFQELWALMNAHDKRPVCLLYPNPPLPQENFGGDQWSISLVDSSEKDVQ